MSFCRSRGLQHVQALRLGASEFLDYTPCPPCQPLIYLLPNFPHNTLRVFKWGDRIRPTYGQLKDLWQSQKYLSHLQLDINSQVDRPSLQDLLHNDLGVLRSLRSVRRVYLRLSNTVYLSLCGELLAKLEYKQLQGISLRVEQARDVVPQYLSMQMLHCLPTTLRYISLDAVKLSRSGALQLDNWPCLTGLRLLSCFNVGPILSRFSTPRLTSFTIRNVGGLGVQEQKDLDRALNSMLKRFSTLETAVFELFFSADVPPAARELARSLSRHSQQLKSLIFNCESFADDDQDLTEEIVLGAIRRCINLKELALDHSWKGMKDVSLVRLLLPRSFQLVDWYPS